MPPIGILVEGLMMSLIMVGGVVGVVFVLGIVGIKLKARDQWFLEFNNNGTLSYEMHRPTPSGVIESRHGDYYVPPTARMKIGWPLGVPAVMQEYVWHEKFVMGNPEPIEYDMDDSTNLSMFIQQTREAETRAITQIQEGLASYTGLRNPILGLIALGVLLAIVAAAAAAYFGYTLSGELDIIQAKLSQI